jgi:transcription elongation factor GreB
MSRAFVKERDDAPVTLPVTDAPHDVTAAGLRRLRSRLAAASDADRPALERRIGSARVAAPPEDPSSVAFGATVTVRGAGGDRLVTLTGDDDIDIAQGRIGLDSPLARALLGRRAGQQTLWRRPAGNERLTIVALDYSELA